jgi:hypothetical protein
MSETGVGSSTRNGGLYDAAGKPIQQIQQGEQNLEPLVSFAREQPLATALGALILGYILGKTF